MNIESWTDRFVEFTVHNRKDFSDDFIEDLADYYYSGWRRWVLRGGFVASSGLVVKVAGWPWWVPAWAARRSVARRALLARIRGEAVSHIERVVW